MYKRQGIETGIIFGAVTDNCRNALHVSFRVVLVPGLGTNLFSVNSAMQKGVASLFYPDNPRLESESGDVVIPMESHEVDASGKLVCSIRVRPWGDAGGLMVPGISPDGLALMMESTGLWQRRMGHINGKSLKVLRNEPTNGVDKTGDVKDCSVCPLGKSTQKPHPKRANYGVLRPIKHVSVDTLGPFSPPALGGFKYAAKLVDQQTKWKEVVLMKDKTSSEDALALLNKGTVISTGERIHCLHGDQGTEFTSAAFRQHWQASGIKL